MINLRVKVTSENKSTSVKESLPDNYSICKENHEFIKLIEKICEDTGYNPIDEVKIFSNFEW